MKSKASTASKPSLTHNAFFKSEALSWIEYVVLYLPGKIGTLTRGKYWRKRLKRCGFKLRLSTGVRITGAESIVIGNECGVDRNSLLAAHNGGLIEIGDRVNVAANVHISSSDSGKIKLGDDVIIGPNVVIRASNHKYERKDIPIRQQGHVPGEIEIGNDVWIGANAVILPGVTIGLGSIIGAGSVVTHNIPEYTVAAGTPARSIKTRIVQAI